MNAPSSYQLGLGRVGCGFVRVVYRVKRTGNKQLR